jgi:flagellin-like hook-associated protein FlgL
LEQLNLTKLQILQQTATAMLAQANFNSQAVLALFQ